MFANGVARSTKGLDLQGVLCGNAQESLSFETWWHRLCTINPHAWNQGANVTTTLAQEVAGTCHRLFFSFANTTRDGVPNMATGRHLPPCVVACVDGSSSTVNLMASCSLSQVFSRQSTGSGTFAAPTTRCAVRQVTPATTFEHRVVAEAAKSKA